MPATPVHALRYPAATDPADVPSDMQKLASDVDVALLPADVVCAAATRVIRSLLASGDANAAWQVNGDGKMVWGPGGANAGDVNLYRKAVGVLGSDQSIRNGRDVMANAVGSGWGAMTVAVGHDGGNYAASITLGNYPSDWVRLDKTGGRLTSPQQIVANNGDSQLQTLVGYSTQGAYPGIIFGTAGDCDVFRSGSQLLQTSANFKAGGGTLYLGGPSDTELHRNAAGQLRTGGSFIVDGNMSVSGTVYFNAVAGNVGGVVNWKVPIYRASDAVFLGYLPLYSA
jgi:hypothetical protein